MLTYERSFKRLIAAWQVLVGVWAPKRWELSVAALSQYTTPQIPPENPWIDKNKAASPASSSQEPPPKVRPRRRPSSRTIMKHVLRARGEAVKALYSFLIQLESSRDDKRVKASVHLARQYGWTETLADSEDPQGWRKASEVIEYLRRRGAKIASLQQHIEGDFGITYHTYTPTVPVDTRLVNKETTSVPT